MKPIVLWQCRKQIPVLQIDSSSSTSIFCCLAYSIQILWCCLGHYICKVSLNANLYGWTQLIHNHSTDFTVPSWVPCKPGLGVSINEGYPNHGWFLSWKVQISNGWFGALPILGHFFFLFQKPIPGSPSPHLSRMAIPSSSRSQHSQPSAGRPSTTEPQ